MKVTVHISHSETDDLGRIQDQARALGLNVTSRGGFLGKHHTEIEGDMTPATLESMLQLSAANTSVAA